MRSSPRCADDKTGKLMEVPIKRVFQGHVPRKVATETAAEPEGTLVVLNYASNYAQ